MRAERPLPLLPERSLEQGAEDRRLDLAPGRVGRLSQQLELLAIEVDARGSCEQRAVGVRRAGVDALGRTVVRLVQIRKQLPQVVAA